MKIMVKFQRLMIIGPSDFFFEKGIDGYDYGDQDYIHRIIVKIDLAEIFSEGKVIVLSDKLFVQWNMDN